jgi:glycosyltransferase domain-containing protein
MSDSFSILLVLKDRPAYTKRFLHYLNYIRFPYPIVIADGGSDKEIQNVLKNNSSFSNLRYEYHHYGYDETLDEFHNKMASAINLVQTPLVSVMDNDDFMLLEGIEKSVKFLKENKDYSSTRGQIQLTGISNNVSGHLMVGSNMYTKFPNHIDSPTALERIKLQSKWFHGNWHNVTRTNHVKACWNMLGISKPTNMRFTEQTTGYMNVVFGKGARFDYPWLLHQQADRIKIKDGTLNDHFPPQENWINSNHWENNFIKMAEMIGVSIAESDGISVDDAIESFYQSYVLKLPNLKNILNKKIIKCREIGYNKERVEKLRLVVSECNIQEIKQIEQDPLITISINEELNILQHFLINFRV